MYYPEMSPGSRADMASRAESCMSRLSSAASLQGPEKASVDEVSS